MSLPVLTAVGQPRCEADLTSGLCGEAGVEVVRRCVDLADLLAAAAAGLARAVIVSADLRRLDRDALSRLAAERVAVVGLVDAADEGAEGRLRQLGVRYLLAHDASSAEVAAVVRRAVAELDRSAVAGSACDWAVAATAEPGGSDAPDASQDEAGPPTAGVPGSGRVVAVWGAIGAPGRTTLAVNLAAELAGLGVPTLLVDADTYGAAVGQLLGLLDESPGLAAACRLANHGGLDLPGLGRVAVEVSPSFRVLTGIARASRWPEIRASSLLVVLGLARSLVPLTVVDCGFGLEQDEELSYDTTAPCRNAATLAVLGEADEVIGVLAADPIGLARYLRALPDLSAVIAGRPPLTVVNRLRRGVIGRGDPRREVGTALERYGGLAEPCMVVEDRAALDAAVLAGRALAEVAPGSPARLAIRELAAGIAGVPEPRGRRARRRSRTQRSR